MIVSHKHRFIFLKTEKTAGTSLQSALAAYIGPDDIISGKRRDPVTNKRRGQTVALGLGRYIKVPTEIKRRLPAIAGYYPHMPARQLRDLVGRQVWNSYFKFAVERNPWDRQVSNYFQRQSKDGAAKRDFERYICSPIYRRLHHVRLDNWGIYTIDDEIAVDLVMRYETLEADYRKLLDILGLETPVELPLHRANHRPADADYRRFYNERTIDLVARWYHKEIEAFGYSF